MTDYSSLLNRLIDGCAPRTVTAPQLSSDVSDTLGRVTVQSKTEALLQWRDGQTAIGVDRETREWAKAHPDAVWVIDLAVKGQSGWITPFCPTRILPLSATIPIRVESEDMRKRFPDSHLRANDDLAKIGAIQVLPNLSIAAIGQHNLAALDTADGERLTWWLPDGRALEMRILADESGAVALELTDIIAANKGAEAHCGPNVLLILEKGASVPFDLAATTPFVRSADAPILKPERSELFDAWARYTALLREEREDRERKRAAQPIDYFDATQRDKLWQAKANMTDEAIAAWLGSDAEEGRRPKINQPVALMKGEAELGNFTVVQAQLRGPGRVDLFLQPQKGAAPLPVAGHLEARADKGEKVREERERDAVDCLSRGLAACERLPLLLTTPEVASLPRIERLPKHLHQSLDDDQTHAVKMIVGCSDIVAIQGPPGTGKTRVIAEALQQIAALPRPKAEVVRIMVSSVQNEAVRNVMEKLAETEGILFSMVQRKARDEEESFDFAQSMLEQSRKVIGRLHQKMGVQAIEKSLAAIDVQEQAVSRVRSVLAAGPALHSQAANLLDAQADDSDSLIGGQLRIQASAIAEALRAPIEPPIQVAEPERTAPPSEAADVPVWWSIAQMHWSARSRASVGAAVAGIEAALRRPKAIQDLFLKRSWAEFQQASAADAPRPTAMEKLPEMEVGSSTNKSAHEWLQSTLKFLADRRAEVLARPGAIAVQFLHALEHDAQAWQAIVSRHGNAVAATCSMAAKAKLNPGQFYDWVIIDEAGRASPFELLIPMVQGKRIALIGDHRQLPPTVDDAIARRATENNVDPVDLSAETLFSLMFRLLPSACTTRLATQYRMHGDIGGLDNQLFYASQGEPVASYFRGDKVLDRTSKFGVFNNRPLVWQEVAPGGSTCSEENPAHAQHVLTILRAYAGAGALDGHIAIICPYRRQRELYEKLLGKEPSLKNICQIKTIDAVQGREYPVVILDLVRNDRRAGFLASANRLNVAISRAQHQLIVVGAATRWLDPNIQRKAPQLAELVRILSRLEAKQK